MNLFHSFLPFFYICLWTKVWQKNNEYLFKFYINITLIIVLIKQNILQQLKFLKFKGTKNEMAVCILIWLHG